MHDTSLTPEAERARRGGPQALAAALRAARDDTLATFADVEAALPALQVPLRPELNPPLWELGHIGWFQAWWIGRNPARADGVDADPEVPRRPSGIDDTLYDSSRVPHDSRWSLPLPDAAATRDALAAQLQETLTLLAVSGADDRSLYFFRLALLHEDMHHEAALYMARGLDLPIEDPRWQPRPLPEPPPPLRFEPGPWQLGRGAAAGFSFDNELEGHQVLLPAAEIDAQVVRWAEYLPFAEAGGYADARWWTAEGWRWRTERGLEAPRFLRREGGRWQVRRFARWQPLDLREAACHLSLHEAEAWCLWAGRRLLEEAEWERAACTRGAAFRWGDVWEWTASPFRPYPGFRPHPYRDYSQPWFDGRPVLRGASHLTQPRLRHARYRNFFPAGRHDVPAGLRTAARSA